MKLGILAYVPPPPFGCAVAFLRNLQQFKTQEELILYSDYDYQDANFYRPQNKPIMLPPEGAPHHARINEYGKTRPAAMSNMVWHVGLNVAKLNDLTHILYLEADCRVYGDYWDKRIWEEFFNYPFPCVMGGTVVAYNPVNGGRNYFTAWQKKMVQLWSSTEFPLVVYGAPPIAADSRRPAFYANGACGVYSMHWMTQIFDLKNMLDAAVGRPWDYLIGEKLYEQFGEVSLELVAQLNSVYSAYGDEMGTEQSRLDLLRSGKVSAIHQVKSHVAP